MDRLGMTLDRARLAFGWGELLNWSQHLPTESATWRAMNPDEAHLESRIALWAIMADVYDAIATGSTNIVEATARRRQRRPKPHHRPWDKDTQTFGKGAIPVKDFDAWYYGENKED